MEVISVGKRLKSIRKQLGIRQDEITGDAVTRNMISMIETDKASLTPKLAQIVANQINEICVKRGINYKISVEALLESEEDQIKKNALQLVEEIKSGNFNLNDERNKSIVLEFETQLGINGDFEVAFELDVVCEDYFSDRNQYFEAYYYCKRSVELSIHLIDDPRTFKAYNNISFYLLHLERYEEALHYCNSTLDKFYKMEPDDRYRVLMNKNLAASKLGDLEIAKQTIDAMLKISNLGMFERNKAWISKANRLNLDGDWKSAVEIYERIYPELKGFPQRDLILSNLIDIYIQNEDLTNLKKVMEEAVQELDRASSEYQGKVLFKLSKGYLKLGQDKLFLEYNQKAFDIYYQQRRPKELKEVLAFRITYYCENNDTSNVCQLVELVERLHDEKILKRDDQCVWVILSFLAQIEDMKSIGKLTQKFLDLN